MNRFLAWVLLTGIFPAPLFALGLGKLDLQSGLNEPFEATIELLSPTRDELDNLTVRLADSEAFARAGIDRPFILSQLRFEVEAGETGGDRVRVYSREVMREPFLNFLVEASWSHGRLYREYTVLLDPPLYDAGGFAAPAPAVSAAPPAQAESAAAELPPIESAAGVAPAAASYSGGDYGPTVANDTLWSIASRTRPDANITVQQMMLALVRTNPDAFTGDNVNGLKRGQILRMPSQEELASLAPAEAFNQVKAQYAVWQQAGGVAAAPPQQRPAGATGAEAATPAAAAPAVPAPAPTEAKSELKLVSPSKEGAAADQGSTQVAAGKADESLALANEQVEALSQENVDLKSRLSESQTIVDDLKRLIALKDDELAAMQKKLASGAAQPVVQPQETEPAEATPEAKAPEPVKESKLEPAPAAEKAPAAPPAESAAPVEAEPAPAEETVEAEEETPAPAKKPAPTPVSTSEGLLDQVLGLVMGNLQLVAIVGGGFAVLLGVVFYISRRRRMAAESESVALEFPDFSGSEVETILPGGAEAEDEVEEAELPAPEAAPAKAGAAAPAAKAAVATAAAPPAKPAAPVEEPEAPQEDPMAPVNVFMAYEHFDQAEEFVHDAINREPDNLDFHVKLLEVLSAANERKKYEAAAKVLHDKVGGAGAYWESALFYWDTMSPGRALFAEPAAGEEEGPSAAAGGGLLDLTAGEESKGGADDMGLDFDLGEATAAPAAAPPVEEQVLDITAGSEGMSLEPSAGPAAAEEDVLDVTAAVGLEPEAAAPAAGGGEEGVLDLSQGGGEDLLDVTAHADLESSDLKEDLLDVTTATGAGADAEDLLAAPAEPAAAADEGGLDFDLNLGGAETPAEAEPVEEAPKLDNVIDFEGAGGKDEGSLDLDFTAGGIPEKEEGGFALDLDTGEPGGADELSLESAAAEGGLELDMGGADSGSLGLELENAGGDAEPASEIPELDLSSFEESAQDAADVDMEGTVGVPKGDGLSLDGEEDEEEDEDHTVFVPRTKDAQEQTAEDEIATKLDLAKAYVELGDKDSAKTILNEVISAGNPQQKKQAQDLMKQMS